MLRKDIGFKLAIQCKQSAFDDDFDHLEMSEEVPDLSSFRISDTFQIKPDGCSLSENFLSRRAFRYHMSHIISPKLHFESSF